jgi:hypothetical protein
MASPEGTTLGASLIALLSLGLTLPPWIGMPSKHTGAGELEITRGSHVNGLKNGTRLLAPTFVNSGTPIPEGGTTEARLIWFVDLCDGLLDCDPCPPIIDPAFNSSMLEGALLIHDFNLDERLYMCGMNRLGRALAGAGLVALATNYETTNPLWTPGYSRAAYWLGEHRDHLPHGGDLGIPFPSVDLTQASLAPICDALDAGVELRAVLKPTRSNQYIPLWFGLWAPIRTIVILGHLFIAEVALSFLASHVKASGGMRPDLAQFALVAEVTAHLMFSLDLVDPLCAFYWGFLPYGSAVAFLVGGTVLTCCSTLCLAAYWHQLFVNDGLTSVVPTGRLSFSLAALST